MDGPHDLGGKENFGPIDVTAPDFRHDWERRAWGIIKTVDGPAIPIDWFRFTVENLPPAAYLSIPYFEKWCLTEMALCIDAGVFTLDEALAGGSGAGGGAAVRSVDALEEAQRGLNRDFSADPGTAPRFAVGEAVVTAARPRPGHTRLPAYARAARGRVIAHHGGHLLADAGAEGRHVAEHLYTVEFACDALWPEADGRDTVCLDLWESYLAPAR